MMTVLIMLKLKIIATYNKNNNTVYTAVTSRTEGGGAIGACVEGICNSRIAVTDCKN